MEGCGDLKGTENGVLKEIIRVRPTMAAQVSHGWNHLVLGAMAKGGGDPKMA